MFDDIALTIVAMMSNCHILVLCHNNYWTTHSNNEYKDCTIQLAYFGGSNFKSLLPKTGGADAFLGCTSQQTLEVIDDDPVSVTAAELETVEPTPPSPEHPHIPDDSDLQRDLIGTGIMPELDLPEENAINDADSVHNDVDNTDVTDDAQQNDNAMDTNQPDPVLDPDNTNEEVHVIEKDSDETNIQDVGKDSDNISDEKPTSEDINANSKKENNVDSSASESDEDKTDSDSGIEDDGWEPKSKR